MVALLAVAALMGMILFFLNRLAPDPVYHGKRLSRWLQGYVSSSRGSPQWQEIDEAVRGIGTNSIPFLLHLFRERDSSLKLKLVALAGRQRIVKFHFIPAEIRNWEASMAVSALGDTAKGAVPELIKIYNADSSSSTRCAIEDAFSWIGPNARPALPLLLRAATNSDPMLRANTLWALGEIRAEPQLCVPVLIYALHDSNEWVQTSATHALGKFGTNSQSAIPLLKEMANTAPRMNGVVIREIQLQTEARNALKKINPTLSEKPPPDLTLPIADPFDPSK